MRFFNTEGPVRPDEHYAIQSLDRVDVEELLGLIRAKRYFVLHAPRQTGKTSALIALRDLLNSGKAGDFRCLHTNVEVGQVARDDTARGIRAILSRWPCARGCCTTTFRTSRGVLCWKHRGRTMHWAICCPTGAWRTRRRWCCWSTRSTRWSATPCSRCCASSARATSNAPKVSRIDGNQPPRIANPIYAEVVPRELGYVLQDSLDVQAAWYVDDDGRLDMTKLLTAFGTFFGEHSEHWLDHLGEYREAGPQLILQAYLQRVVNGGGRIEREYGLGRGRTDLLVLWPREAGQSSDLWERFVVECKVLRDSDRKSLEWTVEEGMEQTLGYMKKCGAEEGHLVVIDRRAGAKERRGNEGGADRS